MGVKRMQRAKLAAAYLLLALAAALGWLYSCLPDRVYLEPGQALYLPRFAWVEPQRGHGSQNVASTRAVGSYQTTLTLGGWLPIKTIRAVVTERPRVTVCGTPFGVKMFSEGALIVGFSEIGQAGGGTSNPAKEAGLHLGDRVICIGQTRTESNEAVKEALDAAEGQSVEVVYIRSGEQKLTALTPVWDGAAEQWRAGMWVRDSSAGVGTLTFADEELGVFAGLGHPISDSDTGESVALRSGEIVPCEITGCSAGTAGSPGELKGHFLSAHAIGTIRINGQDVTRMKQAKLSQFRREELGFIFQDSNLLDTLTARENIALPLTIARVNSAEISTRVQDVAARLSVSQVLDKYPYQMSGGQQQRVAAARALVTDPTMIMADEPTGALDSKSARLLLESLEALNRRLRATVLMVTHDSFAASYTSRVLFIRDGKIFTELRRGDTDRREFFDRIMEVVAMMGGEGSDAL